jgi:hypothetical protein
VKLSRRHGRARLQLGAPEAAVLVELFDELDASLARADPTDPVSQRLFPAAYPQDEAAEAEFRTLTESSLRAERHERVAACRADLAAGAADIELDADTARRWIQVLNDLRLAIGTRLGITEDDDHVVERPDDPRVVYYWLTGIQDAVVQALMR